MGYKINLFELLRDNEAYHWYQKNCGCCSHSESCEARKNMCLLEGNVVGEENCFKIIDRESNNSFKDGLVKGCKFFKEYVPFRRKTKEDKDQLSFKLEADND